VTGRRGKPPLGVQESNENVPRGGGGDKKGGLGDTTRRSHSFAILYKACCRGKKEPRGKREEEGLRRKGREKGRVNQNQCGRANAKSIRRKMGGGLQESSITFELPAPLCWSKGQKEGKADRNG